MTGFFFFKLWVYFIYLFIYLFVAVLGLRFYVRAFSSCGKWGATLDHGARASHYRGLSLRSTGSRRAGSVIVAHGPSCSAACGIFPDQGSNPYPLHWQADSQPLRHQGSPPGNSWCENELDGDELPILSHLFSFGEILPAVNAPYPPSLYNLYFLTRNPYCYISLICIIEFISL